MTQDDTLVSPNVSACLKPGSTLWSAFQTRRPGDTADWTAGILSASLFPFPHRLCVSAHLFHSSPHVAMSLRHQLPFFLRASVSLWFVPAFAHSRFHPFAPS